MGFHKLRIMNSIVISGSGLFSPEDSISNEELERSFNTYVEKHNTSVPAEQQLALSSAEFIKKASGISNRKVLDKAGILDPERMRPRFAVRGDDELSIQAEMGLKASREALSKAQLQGTDIDAVLVACSNYQRAYPAISIELQQALGAGGFAFDMNVACSSATFGITQAASLISSRAAKRVLVVSPEICSGHLNFRDRDSHFIFGDACTAVILEEKSEAKNQSGFEVLGTKLSTSFSNNIRNNLGFLTRCEERLENDPALLFYQEGRKVFKEVTTLVSKLLADHLQENDLSPESLKCLWLHQANAAMNQLIAKRLLGREATAQEAPIILDDYANTSSAGSVIAFHLHQSHFQPGDVGVICSFGAGYSIGSVLVRKL